MQTIKECEDFGVSEMITVNRKDGMKTIYNSKLEFYEKN